jgi:hypothetical protein
MYRGVSNAVKLPTPDRDNIVTSAHEVYENILEVNIQKTFQLIGFRFAEFEEEDRTIIW